jgi:hypothetical protein
MEQGYRIGNPHVFRARCQMVLLKAEGRKSQEVADILGSCQQAVNGCLWRYKNDGIKGLGAKPDKGECLSSNSVRALPPCDCRSLSIDSASARHALS